MVSDVVPVVVSDGFDGGFASFLRICDDCRPRQACPKHQKSIDAAYAHRAAQNAAVVAAAEDLASTASANLVTA